MIEKLADLDRRIIYGAIFIVVLMPLIRPFGLPLAITSDVEESYKWVHENIYEDDIVFIDVDFDPSSAPELLPQYIAMSKDFMQIGAKIVLVSYLPGGFMYQKQLVEETAPEFDYEYGCDIISLPFKAGNESAYNALGRDLKSLYTEDYYGDRLQGMVLWERINSITDAKAVICFCAGDQAIWMIRHVGQVHDIPIINGTVASSGAFMTPFWESKQLSGFVVGMSGAAEYEQLSNFVGRAASAMDAQSFGHILITLFVVLGNTGYLVAKRRDNQ